MPATLPTIDDLRRHLERLAPAALAEEWDNVGLLIGDPSTTVTRIMTCLTPTPESVAEAIREGASLIVAHHPLPFRGVKRITTEEVTGQMLWDLIRAGIGLLAPHTGFDSSLDGINQRIAVGLGLEGIRPLKPHPSDPSGLQGTGRFGRLPRALTAPEFAAQVASFFSVAGLQVVDGGRPVTRVAIGCGAAGDFLADAVRLGCDGFVVGELRFHAALEARACGVTTVVPGHHATERFAIEQLATELAVTFPTTTVWASRDETDPLVWQPHDKVTDRA